LGNAVEVAKAGKAQQAIFNNFTVIGGANGFFDRVHNNSP
jgi:hypothetical protein